MNNENNITYQSIKSMIIDCSTQDPYILQDLKQIFKTHINSTRRLDCIENINNLINCLERRDIISENNINNLRIIIERGVIKNAKELHSKLDAYEEILKKNSNSNIVTYKQLRLLNKLKETTITNTKTLSNTISYTSNKQNYSYNIVLTVEKRNAIYKLLAQGLGNNWRRLGRSLGINEGAMDEIELQFPRDLTSRIYKLLTIFEEDDNTDAKQLIDLLCIALDDCQRKDLRRKIENLISKS